MPAYVVRPSVHPSSDVTLVYADHISWPNSNVIVRFTSIVSQFFAHISVL